MKKKTKGRVKAFEAKANGNEEKRTREPRKSNEPAKKKNVKVNKGRLVLTAIVAVLVIGLVMSAKNIFILRAEQKALEEQNKELLLEKDSLEEELDNVNDTEYIEEQARVQLKLIKPGEILYILEDEKENKEENDETNEEKDN